MLRIRILGHLQASVAGEPLRLSTAMAPLRLWAYLLVHRETPLPRKHVAFTLWPDDHERTALAHLRRQIHLLQNLLPAQEGDQPWLLADRSTVSWNPECDYWLDAEVFEVGCAEAELDAIDPADTGSRTALEQTLAIYRADLLTDSYDDWVLADRERLRALYGRGLTKLLALQATIGDPRAAVDTAERLVDHDSLSEDAQRLAIGLHYLAGDRAAALKAFRTCEQVFAAELDVEPMAETQRLVDAIRSSAPVGAIVDLLRKDLPVGTDPSALIPLKVPNNLPTNLTSLIGRGKELADLSHRLCTTRLLTLTGPAGCGKSRLALAVAAEATARIESDRRACDLHEPNEACPTFRDGVWWVDLAPFVDPTDTVRAVADVLHVQLGPGHDPTAALESDLEHKEILLLLDGCEHVVEACATMTERLLHTCPDLRVLASSREPLGVYGETTLRVPPLSVPPPDSDSSAMSVLAYDGPQLFLDRARLVLPGTKVTDGNAPAVAAICRRLDGIPLAIELAAAQLQTLSTDQIARRLDDRFTLLSHGSRSAPAHHRTLEAAIDWSFDSLSERERVMFRRLGAFHNGWTLEAAGAICAGDGIEPAEIHDLVTALVLKSLVIVTGTQAGRARTFRMPESIRYYARVKLAGTKDAEAARARHLAYYTALAQEMAPKLQGDEQARWIARLDRDRNNFRAALEYSLCPLGDSEAGLILASSLVRYWLVRGLLANGRDWLRKTLAAHTDAGLTRQRGLQAAAMLAELQGDDAEAERLTREALEIASAARHPCPSPGV